MYGPAQGRAYPYASRNSAPYAAAAPASMSASNLYYGHKQPESHAYSAQRPVSPVALLSRPRAGTNVAGSHTAATSGANVAGSRRHHHSSSYSINAGINSRDSSSSRQRTQSQSYPQPQTRSRSPYPQTNSYSYAHQQPSSSQRLPFVPVAHVPDRSARVIPDLDAVSRRLGEMDVEGRPASASHSSYRSGTYDPGRADPTSRNHQYGYYGSMPQARGDGHSSGISYASKYPAQDPLVFVPPQPRAPSPASHYPFANYGSSTGERGARGDRTSDDRNSQGRGRRSSNTQDTLAPPLHAGVSSSQADSTASDPLIHPALGWWPDQRRPALYWDLSSSSRPRYTKREFDAEELAASPFSPPLTRMRLVLDPHARWAFDIAAPRGERYITLSSLLKDIASLMRAPNKVPHAFWVRASSSKKEAVLRAMLRRTGRTLAVPPPHRRPKTRGQIMEEAVVDGAPYGYTHLLVVDLLCEDVMFAGMEFHKEPGEWVLRTTKRYA